MEKGTNFVGKYLETHDGLKPLNDFLSNEAEGLDTKEKQYTFLLGLLHGKLITVQHGRGVSPEALKWVKSLNMNSDDLKILHRRTKDKLDVYGSWSDEMSGVSEAIGALGGEIKEWNIRSREIPFYLCLGQSLSSYYLPSKKQKANQPNNQNQK